MEADERVLEVQTLDAIIGTELKRLPSESADGGGGGGASAHLHYNRHAHATQHSSVKTQTVVFALAVNPGSEHEVQNPRQYPEAYQQRANVSLLLKIRLPPGLPGTGAPQDFGI
ncbi:hypothetical protein FVE85_0645 [Porphyridium purpureum]|uniref:Uncharacterized protein n=1 Tax=Porphyridium purpureum TaxID=35688 RepID=A0A5J4YZX8_PORPP|nr:hypothetical protein FVE85_0645 [Porphyridium purpureum]|eukprot:POR4892..scf208_2